MDRDAEITALRRQVWQRVVAGYHGLTPPDRVAEALNLGLGGLILFRDNVQDGAHVLSADALQQQIQAFQDAIPQAHSPAWIWVDQEGGPVERLPWTMFPSVPSAWALGQRPDLIPEVLGVQSRALRALGFQSGCTPCLDINDEPDNPVIHVRSYGDTPEPVTQAGLRALSAMTTSGLMAIAKHFPGHGSSRLDSHKTRPVLDFKDAMLSPFRALIQAGCPAVMVAHAAYPELNRRFGEPEDTPASLSAGVIQGLLRDDLGFKGLVVTDDLAMGAVSGEDQRQVALAACRAGVDILLYRTLDNTLFDLVESLTFALQEDEHLIALHHASMRRIEAAKRQFIPHAKIKAPLSPEEAQSYAARWANHVASPVWGDIPESLTQSPQCWIVPDRTAWHAMAVDLPLGEFAGEPFESALPRLSHGRIAVRSYTDDTLPDVSFLNGDPTCVIVAVSCLPKFGRSLPTLLQGVSNPVVWVSAGLPEAEFPLAEDRLIAWLQPASWRPPVIQACLSLLSGLSITTHELIGT